MFKPSSLIFMLALLMTGMIHADAVKPKANTIAVSPAAKPDIPALNWQERSDWINVKTDITPAAVGDGVADDTLALQAALDGVKSGSVIYFPAGRYRVTQPLFMGQKSRNIGVNLIGHGRDTHIVWDGESNETMLTINGQSQSRYTGISFDGQNRAARGFYFFNDGKSSFITNLHLRDLAFRNFLNAGIYFEPELKKMSKTPDKYATAETTYENCLFENCATGVYSSSFNDLNHTFTGCEFRNNGNGLHWGHGNLYVRDSHFEGNTEFDMKIDYSEHGCSIRRVTSTNSRMFLYFSSSVGVLTIENCRVSHWTAPRKAMHLRTGNALLFDNIFEGSVDSQSSVTYERQRGVRVLSNNILRGSTNILFHEQHGGSRFSYTPGAEPRVFPRGYTERFFTTIRLPESASKVKPVDIAMNQSFLKTTRLLPDKVFDAKVDFGAVGNGKTDDSQAIQKTIDAAREHGNNAVAYIPTGKYNITKTIHITGENYTVAGNGFGSALIWTGEEGQNLVEVKAPKNILLDSLSIGQGDHDRGKGLQKRDLIQIGVNEPTSVKYDRIFTFGKYQRNDRRGIELSNLGPEERVVLDQVQGNFMIDNSAQATILCNVSYEGTLTVQGDSKQRTGFTGFMTRMVTGVEHALVVRNNQSVVLSELYVEQAPNVFWLEGTPEDPAGRVTLQSPKLDSTGKKEQVANARVFNIEGFKGDIFLGTTAYYVTPREMRMSLRGDAKADIYFLGNSFYQSAPVFLDQSPTINVHWLGAIMVGTENREARIESTKTNVSEEDYGKFNALLDDLRTLGTHDIKLNFPALVQ